MDKLERLEQRMDGIEKKLDTIANNHLWHIERDMKMLRDYIGWGVGALLIVNIVAVLYAIS